MAEKQRIKTEIEDKPSIRGIHGISQLSRTGISGIFSPLDPKPEIGLKKVEKLIDWVERPDMVQGSI